MLPVNVFDISEICLDHNYSCRIKIQMLSQSIKIDVKAFGSKVLIIHFIKITHFQPLHQNEATFRFMK